MSAALAAFLEGYAARPFRWGESDCALMLADWLIACGHDDPAAALRGTYGTEAACAALVARYGGLVPLVASCAAHAGLSRRLEPVPGAVGVIGARRSGNRQWGAIFDGALWQVRWGDGLAGFRACALAIWSV